MLRSITDSRLVQRRASDGGGEGDAMLCENSEAKESAELQLLNEAAQLLRPGVIDQLLRSESTLYSTDPGDLVATAFKNLKGAIEDLLIAEVRQEVKEAAQCQDYDVRFEHHPPAIPVL